MRARLQSRTEGHEALLQKVFNDFDLNSSGALTIDEITTMIAKLEISVERRFVRPFFKVIDADNSGGIEFEEFDAFVRGN